MLGDQLDPDSAAFDGFEPARDAVWMCEAPAEATYAWSHKARIAMFLAAMRHARDSFRAEGRRVHYRATGEHAAATLTEALADDLAHLRPARVVLMEPGEHRLARDLPRAIRAAGCELDVRPDRHFLCSREEFSRWMQGRRQPRLEHFYRWMRQRTGWLMRGDAPLGDRWNFDEENRAGFGKAGPGAVPDSVAFEPDAITREVFALVERQYATHPGSLARFDWPVTRAQARKALADFVEHRLADFGRHQDAMWTGQPYLWHSRLSAALNLKLLDPREVCEAALVAHAAGDAPLAAVEGFVRQILGWREYVRGLYFHHMPQYLDDNALGAKQPLPALYWTGQTDMNCLHHAVGQTLEFGYAHHIQRLMVTGLFGLLLGVDPKALHEWYLAVYVDAVEWVELPNTIGMSQWADGGLMGSKPYIASGKYVDRMSNYCKGCRFKPQLATGPKACPFTTLYWDFLARHEARFKDHHRLKLQVKNLARLDADELDAIRAQATELRQALVPKKS